MFGKQWKVKRAAANRLPVALCGGARVERDRSNDGFE